MYGARRLSANQPDIPGVADSRVGKLAGRFEGDQLERNTKAIRDRARHVRRDTLRFAISGRASHQQEIEHIDSSPKLARWRKLLNDFILHDVPSPVSS